MKNPLLAVIEPDGESNLRDYILEYVGAKFDKEDITAEMISEILAAEFPEFLYAYAEENFLRGYRLGLDDAFRNADNGATHDASAE